MRNWKKVNKKYVKEGKLYLDFDFLKTWEKELERLNKNKEGARYKYPNSLIRFCSVIKVVFHLGYRQEQGFLKSMREWIPIPDIPCYTQVQRRVNKLGLNLVNSLAKQEDGQIIAIDASGIKLYNSGEWIREKHKKRKPFLKLHVAVNVKTKQTVALEITEDKVGDNKLGLKLIDKARKVKRVSKALLDGAYDSYKYKTWNGLNARGIKPLIRLRKNAKVNHKRSKVRSQAIKCYKGNEKEWVKATSFGQRWQAETWFSSYKRRFGEHCYSIKPENVMHEILFKTCLCNKLIR
jgi:hypothetical protein